MGAHQSLIFGPLRPILRVPKTSKRVSEFHWSGAESSHRRTPKNPLQKTPTITDMEIRDDYKFLRIEDAFKALHLHVNLIGVIVELGFPNSSGIVDPFPKTFAIPIHRFVYSILPIDGFMLQIVHVRWKSPIHGIRDLAFLLNSSLVLCNRFLGLNQLGI